MSENAGSEPGGGIAIIGMACRVAGADSPTELWDLLASSRDVQSEITRFNARGYYHPDGGPRKGMTNVKDAYMMDNASIDRFDNAFFNMSPQMAIATDPQQRLLLEISYEALENAGIPLEKFVGSDTAVFAGEKDAFRNQSSRATTETCKILTYCRYGGHGLPHSSGKRY